MSARNSASAQAQLRLVTDDEGASYASLVDEAQLAERRGQRDRARRLYDAALHRLREAASGREASALLRWIARTHQVDGDAEVALDCLEAALAIAEVNGDLASIGHATNLKAIVRWQQGMTDEAEQLYLAARETALRAGEAKLAAMTSQNLGVLANIRGDFDLARRHYEASLADYRVLGLPHDVCVALNNLGLLHTHQHHWSEAAAAYNEALQIADILGDVSTRIMVQANVAEHWVAQGALDKARALCDEASEASRNANDDRTRAQLEKLYGIIAREQGDLATAESHLTTAEQLARARHDLLLVAESARERAELHLRQGRNRETLHCLNTAHRLFSQLSAHRDVAELDASVARLENDFLDVVRRWSQSIESKDQYTQGHCERVADLACALAARAGLDAKSLFWFRIGAMLHDVGKLVIPSEVLNKPAPLTPAEWELVKSHPTAGVEMLAGIDFPWDVRPIVLSHHERWDGRGYPQGLRGEEIPLTARVLCIADVYDALTSERAYRRPLSHVEAMDVMRLDVGAQFDPNLFPAFEEVTRELSRTNQPSRARRPSRRRSLELAAPSSVTALDELTGLPLRRAFLERATSAMASRDASRSMSLLVIDVDRFKLINDTYGHLEGDAVLREIAMALQRQMRATDFLGRYAGDEFVALLPDTSATEAMALAERLRAAVHRVPASGMRTSALVATSVSIGVAALPEHASTIDDLFAAADAALYEAKRAGRDLVIRATVPSRDQPEPALAFDRYSGRVAERERLTRLITETLHDGPRVVSIVGEAGVGKSALVREMASEVRMRAGSLVVGRCADTAVRPPLAPWVGVLNAIRVLRVVGDHPWRELPRLLSTVADAPGVLSDGSRFALFEEITEFVRLAATARPLVMVLDDMQWADAASWDLLEHIVAQADRERMLICLAVREEDTGVAFDARRSRLSRNDRFHELRLGRLTRAELREWLHLVLQQPAPDELLDHLVRHTEGNPFIVIQVLRTLVEERHLYWAGEEWAWKAPVDATLPVAVADLLTRRIVRLSERARRILARAALVGRAVDVELMVEAKLASEEELLDAIDEGLAGSVLEVSDIREHRISFAHALLVDLLPLSLNPSRRQRMHLRIAKAMEQLRPSAFSDLAHHFDNAGVAERTCHYACLAAERAAAVYAHREAAAFLDMAQRHADNTTEASRIRFRKAQVIEAAGRYADAETLYTDALHGLSADRQAAAECRRALARIRSLCGAPPADTRRVCHELLQVAQANAMHTECIALLLMLSQAHGREGDDREAEALACESLRLAESAGESRLLAEALTRVGTAVLRSRPEESLVHYERARRLYETVDDTWGQVRCQLNHGVASSRLGNLAVAEQSYRSALTAARAAHSPELAGLAALNLGVVFMKRGRHDDARPHLEESLSQFVRVRNEAHRTAAIYNLAHLAREEGRLADASRLYGAAVPLARAVGLTEVAVGALGGLGLVALDDGDLDEGAAAWDRLEADLDAQGDTWFQGRELPESLGVQLAIRRNDPQQAYLRFQRALALANLHDPYGAAWLVATCAPPMLSAMPPQLALSLQEVVRAHAIRVDAMGLSPLASRFNALVARCPAPPRADAPPSETLAS